MFAPRHLFCILLFFCLILSAATWEERREAIFQQAKAEATKQAEAQIKPESILEELGLSKIPETPTITVEEMKVKHQAAFQEILNKEFPPSYLDDLPTMAELKFPLAKVNETVTIRGSRPNSSTITGKLIKRDENRVIIGSRWIRYEDMPKEVAIFLDPTENKIQRDQWVELQKTIFLQQRKNRAKSLQKELLKLFREEGYICRESDEDTPGEWTPAVNIFNERLAAQRKNCADSLYPGILQKLMQENGFMFLKSQNQWRPVKGEGAPSMMEKMKEKLN
jgi:hypothetical protein